MKEKYFYALSKFPIILSWFLLTFVNFFTDFLEQMSKIKGPYVRVVNDRTTYSTKDKKIVFFLALFAIALQSLIE